MGGKSKLWIENYMNKHSQIENQIEKIVMVDVHDIEPHPQNHYSTQDIEVLASLIELQGGVKEALFLKKSEDGKYLAISGHRRRLAMLLILEKKSEKVTSPLVPAIIRKYENEAEEVFAIAAANSQRKKTVEDKENEIEMMKPYVREQYEKEKAEGKEVGKFRDYLAAELGLTSSVVQRIESLKKLAPELRQEINEGNLDITPAASLTNLPHEAQKQIYTETKASFGKVTEKGLKETRQKAVKSDRKDSDRPNTQREDLEINKDDDIPKPEILENSNEKDWVEDAIEASDDSLEIKDIADLSIEAKKREGDYMQRRLDHLKSLYKIEKEQGTDENTLQIFQNQIKIVEKICGFIKQEKFL